MWMRTSPQISSGRLNPRAAVAVNPLASSLHGPSSPSTGPASQPKAQAFIVSVRTAHTHIHTKTGGTARQRTSERTPCLTLLARSRGSGLRRRRSGISPGDIRRLFLAFGKARLAISHLPFVTRQIYSCFSPVALTDKSPQAAGLHRNGALQQKQATRGPFSLSARALAARPSALWLALSSCVGSLATCSRCSRVLFCAWPRHGAPCRKVLTRHTREGGPATPATSSIKERQQPHCSRVALRQNIFGR